MILSDEELRDLTGFTRADAQQRELDHLGIAYKVRRDGSLVVMREAICRGTMVNEPQLHLGAL